MKVGVLCLFLLAVVAAHASICLVESLISYDSQTLVVDLTLILLSHSTNLRDVHTVLHQLGNDLCVRSASLVLFRNEAHHLFVGHGRLGAHRKRDEK